jgi:hypothetical protein
MNTEINLQNRLLGKSRLVWRPGIFLLLLGLLAPRLTAETFSVVTHFGGSVGQCGGVSPVSDGTTLYGMTRDYIFSERVL